MRKSSPLFESRSYLSVRRKRLVVGERFGTERTLGRLDADRSNGFLLESRLGALLQLVSATVTDGVALSGANHGRRLDLVINGGGHVGAVLGVLPEMAGQLDLPLKRLGTELALEVEQTGVPLHVDHERALVLQLRRANGAGKRRFLNARLSALGVREELFGRRR